VTERIAGEEYRDDRPDDLPPAIQQWPYRERINWVKSMYLREGMILNLLTRANYPEPEPRGKDTHLTKDELAAIYLAVRGVAE
jgi:hypothetical protein